MNKNFEDLLVDDKIVPKDVLPSETRTFESEEVI
jgi:hypothetical protein